MLEFRVFTFGVFSLTTLLGTLVFALLIGTETILPLYTQNVRDVTAFDTGLMLLPGAIVMGFMSPIIGRILTVSGKRHGDCRFLYHLPDITAVYAVD